ncbi:MAG TPA: SRPBCC domain-containing protein [Puia sp.]|nr:SRPBCC domain-containing protein [Puia sp.]
MEKQLTLSRVFDAPVEDVWKIWTESEYVKQWWGPDKFTCPLAKINFKEGASSLVSMQAPHEFGGQVSYSIWTYTKIINLQSIEFVQNLANEEGIKQKPTALGMPPDFPEDVRTLVTFKVIDKNKTEMTVTEFADFGQISHFAKLGLEQSLDKALSIFKKLSL